MKLRKQIDALLKTKRALAALNVSSEALSFIQAAIDELEDAFIAGVNHDNANG
jgi:HD superfamily phosphohydrolase YqeK